MTHLSDLATLLATNTSLTITQYPEEIALGLGYILFPGQESGPRVGSLLSEVFYVQIGSDTLANLETAIGKFLTADSYMPSGYHYAGTAGYPIWISTTLDKKKWSAVEFMALIRIEARYTA